MYCFSLVLGFVNGKSIALIYIILLTHSEYQLNLYHCSQRFNLLFNCYNIGIIII